MDFNKRAGIAATTIFATMLAANANAGLIHQYDFEGNNVEGTLLFDTVGADGAAANPQVGLYSPNLLSGSSITFGSDIVDLTGWNANVFDDVFLGTDELFSVFNVAGGSEVGGNTVTNIIFQQRGPNSALSSDDLIDALQADFSVLEMLSVNLSNGNSFDYGINEDQYSSFEMPPTNDVPEPGTLALFAGGLGIAGYMRRRQNKAQAASVGDQEMQPAPAV